MTVRNDSRTQIQLLPFAYKPLLDKSYENGVIFRGQNLPSKCYQPLELPIHSEKRFRSFQTGNIGSVGQKVAKLLAVKVGI